MRMALIEMGHDQPPTPAVTDSATGDVFVNDNICQQCSIEIDMLFYWVRDRFRQGNFWYIGWLENIIWKTI